MIAMGRRCREALLCYKINRVLQVNRKSRPFGREMDGKSTKLGVIVFWGEIFREPDLRRGGVGSRQSCQ